ncbi:dephospho-CoA kinase/protein folding accessory domain-containing protein [Streptomyces sp. YIM 121038]|uniref:GrpB family protein n=1 Tax=Streptomyces sp. YIM 121038 TaxID=2136401 RepID=UPI00111084B7|nr:GrpB family protein [Streptomyces sp. YIM 121038]QCX73818.1 dephospho-CoA kinase/protein folding accessory domain-containing protein [Streptomyces sp. YIM 121038]
MTDEIVVSACGPRWSERLEDLRQRPAPHVAGLALSIEHVGGTGVPGCAAKPVVDLGIVLSGEASVPELVSGLAGQGCQHEGGLGIQGREAFPTPPGAFGHHLYGGGAGTKPRLGHVLLRDCLRLRPAEVRRCSAWKMALAQRFTAGSEGGAACSASKSALVEELMARSCAV